MFVHVAVYRYANQTAALRSVFSEYALIKYRIIVEIEWLKAMARSTVSHYVIIFLSAVVLYPHFSDRCIFSYGVIVIGSFGYYCILCSIDPFINQISLRIFIFLPFIYSL